MNVTCPSCSTVYRVDPAKVPAEGVRARCRVCAAIFPVAPEPAPAAARAPAQTDAPPAPAAPPAPEVAVPAEPREPPPPAAIQPEVIPPPPPAREEPRTTAPWTLQEPSRRSAAPSPVIMPPASPARPATGPSRSAGAASPAVAPRPPAAGAGTAGEPRRMMNPFLAQNPEAKARRLARALISDLVVYNPERRQQALQNGQLKQVFEEEIRKSWEEYSEQVGRETAESTPFFTEALNEILAGGKKVF